MHQRHIQAEWRYIFRETVHNVWFWRNRVLHGDIHRALPAHVISRDIILKVTNLDCVLSIRKYRNYIATQ